MYTVSLQLFPKQCDVGAAGEMVALGFTDEGVVVPDRAHNTICSDLNAVTPAWTRCDFVKKTRNKGMTLADRKRTCAEYSEAVLGPTCRSDDGETVTLTQ